ncbi:serine hydrolase [Dyadobacter sp. CY343]|uniref:serine hydrolase domain-containing protein n=1 Tax=Dyadobacter sp. CY343 TaxID=2907299 RepID=UPI001F17BB60|nr:serine hydrolase domain-containing protein [Dyadobacter sp. CY343]MCE7062143.1 beta-lactamase family protein [Dyadobacter sp. CY343]
MKHLILFMLAVMAVSCDGQKNSPIPHELEQDPLNPIDTVCKACKDSTVAAGEADLRYVVFDKNGPMNIPVVTSVRNKITFYYYLKSNIANYGNSVMAYIGRGDSTLFCYRQGEYNTDSRLPIMSASKPVTAAVIMTLVEAGKLALDDKVSKYIPSFNNEKKEITIRQLLAHTSGLVYESRFDSRSDLTLQQNIDSIALRTQLQFVPGKGALYGSVSYGVASRIAEIVEKKSWATIFQERIGSKCGMEDVVYSPDHPANPATGYGIMCSMNEYLRFLTMIYNKGTYNGVRVLSVASVETMEADNSNRVDPTYGLGLWRSEFQNNTAKEVAVLSARGVHAWINREKNYFGLLFTQAGFDTTIQPNLAFRKLVRENL